MSENYRFGAVIPAAGLSSRMGAFKPLLPFAGQTVIETAVGSAIPFLSEAVAVVGYRGGDLRVALRRKFGESLQLVENPDFASTDMLYSIQLGLQAMEACDAFFLLPADMPMITDAVYRTLTDAFDDIDDVIYPVVGGRRGHPPLISARLIPEILAYDGGDGLRAILSGRREKLIEVADRGIFTDLDTPQDYERSIENICGRD